MANDYFDPTNDDHLEYVKEEYHDDSDLVEVANNVERELFRKFENVYGDAYGLYGYDDNVNEAAPHTVKLIREFIGTVITHRLKWKGYEEDVQSESRGKRSKTYRYNIDPRWPKGCWSILRPIIFKDKRVIL